MLESAEIGHRLSKAIYAREEPHLRDALLNAQYDLSRSGRGPLLIIFSGVEGGGRGETANKLTEWMDPRYIHVAAFGPRAPEEAVRPLEWRYWRALPPKGQLGIFLNAWYGEAMEARLAGKIDAGVLRGNLEAIRDHEQMLADEGVVPLKFWIHLSKAEQKRRLQELDHDPRKTWRVTPTDWHAYRSYNKAYGLWEQVLEETSTANAPWKVVEGTDERYRNLTVGKLVLDGLKAMLDAKPVRSGRSALRATPPASPLATDNVGLIRGLDLSKTLSHRKYREELEEYEGKFVTLSHHKRFARHSLILVFEGTDAAGKGGAIRRVTGALDARQYVTVPVAAPSSEERAYPYLWRFWRNVPPLGGITIFDRSWYGRVLVERVEGLCTVADWMRAYHEINRFEEQLTQGGAIVVKFWLQISKAEQLRRFKKRETTSFKRFKITPDDWRNREKWDAYELAVCDMVDRTSTTIAPWTLVEAEHKYFARIKILKTIVHRLEQQL